MEAEAEHVREIDAMVDEAEKQTKERNKDVGLLKSKAAVMKTQHKRATQRMTDKINTQQAELDAQTETIAGLRSYNVLVPAARTHSYNL